MLGDFETAYAIYPTVWYRSAYELKETDCGLFIVAKAGANIERYQPLKQEPPHNQPQKPEEWDATLPHIALARINLDKEGDIIAFVNRWGLLGLWAVKEYSDWDSPFCQKPSIKDEVSGRTFSQHFINSDFHGSRSHIRYQEPLGAFVNAAKEYQYMFSLLEGNKNRKSEAQNLINRYLRDCPPQVWFTDNSEKWEDYYDSPSLLHTCYILVASDLKKEYEYYRCQHPRCRRVFISTIRSDAKYCTTTCKNRAKRLRRYYEIEKPRKGLK